MNAEVDKMKQDVGALLQGESDGNTQSGRNKGGDKEGSKNSHKDENNTNSNISGDNDNLSEHDQWELDKAIRSGWKEPDNFKGNKKDFLSPKQWNINVALLKRADRAEQEARHLRGQVDTFGDRVENVMKVAKANAIAELEAKKEKAVEEADYGEVKKIDKQIADTEKDYAVEKPDVQQQGIRHEVEDWMDNNSWFGQNKAMTEFALDFQFSQLNRLSDPKNPTTEELQNALKKTTRAVKNEYPDEFKSSPRAVSQTLESGNLRPTSKKFGYNDLTSQEKTVCKEMVRTKAMTQDEYVQAIVDIREQGGKG